MTRISLGQARLDAPGETVALSLGETYYELAGPPQAPIIIFVHGFSVPCYVWDPSFHALTVAGFRALRYDLFGRGLSDRPKVRNTRQMFVRQLVELLDALDLSSVLHVAGLSMGGPIAAGFAAEYPARVASLSLLAPAGLLNELPASMRLLRWCGVGEAILAYRGQDWLTDALEVDLYHREHLRAYVSRYRQQMRWRGFQRSILSTIRHGPLRRQDDVYRQVAANGTPTMVVWGEEDRTVPFVLHYGLLSILSNAVFHAIPDAGHIAHFEKPEVVGPLLIDHITRNGGIP